MYLGIDLGTSGVKLLLLDDAHTVIATADAAVPQYRPQPLPQHPLPNQHPQPQLQFLG